MALTKRKARVVAVCDGCGENIEEGAGWRRLPNPSGGWLNYHHIEKSEATGEFTNDGQHELRDITVVKTCVPKTTARKPVAS